MVPRRGSDPVLVPSVIYSTRSGLHLVVRWCEVHEVKRSKSKPRGWQGDRALTFSPKNRARVHLASAGQRLRAVYGVDRYRPCSSNLNSHEEVILCWKRTLHQCSIWRQKCLNYASIRPHMREIGYSDMVFKGCYKIQWQSPFPWPLLTSPTA